jgi:2-polyprenyl-3-methyl-5-hydroxy-6-metoxy-1,4-benzoquinol methylase
MRNWLLTTEGSKLEYYNGKLIHACNGLHDDAISQAHKHFPPGSRIIDIGSGAGAFAERLHDNGFHVTGIDIDDSEWTSAEIPFHTIDVMKPFSRQFPDTFEYACCIEVIEHIENPWHLLREIHSLLKPKGKLILSTPNITSFFSRLMFLRTGRFLSFHPASLDYGHINPIPEFELRIIAEKTGWRVLDVASAGYLPVFDFSSWRPKAVAFNFLRGLAYVWARGQKKGYCLLCVLERDECLPHGGV